MDEELKVLSCQAVLFRVVRDFCRRNPELDFDEVLGDCQVVMLRAVRSCGDGPASLTSFVWRCIYNHLLARVRSAAWRRRMSKSEMPTVQHAEGKRKFDLESFLFSLSDRAAEAVVVAVGGSYKRTELVEILRREFCWEWSVIREVFDEVREALR